MSDHADPRMTFADALQEHDERVTAILDALVAERDEAVEMSRQMVAAYELAGEETEAAEKERDEARRLLTLMRKRKGDFELPNYWKGEIDAALREDA